MNRTCNLRLRRSPLYPIELMAVIGGQGAYCPTLFLDQWDFFDPHDLLHVGFSLWLCLASMLNSIEHTGHVKLL